MRDQQIQQRELLSLAHCLVSPSATLCDLQHQLAALRTRTLAFWHDHSLLCSNKVYDREVFLTEWQKNGGSTTTNIQEEIEQPVIHMIAPRTSALSVGFDIRPTGMPTKAIASDAPIADQARFFCSFVETNQPSSSSAGPR